MSKTIEMLNTQQAAEYLNVEVNTLAQWRVTGRYGLPYVKVGRHIRYRLADLEAWVESRTHQNTGYQS